MELGTGSDGAPLEWAARLEEWTAGRDPVPAAGESFQQVGERVQAVIDELLAAGAGRGVVLVAHSEVIGAFLRHLQPQGAGRNLDRLDNGGITVVEARAGSRPVVVSVNRIPPATAPPE
jgi:broad specificity phosphatase PhoE